ncbi:MAG: serine--tRNA ligase [Candidatus Cloacimonadota bacterium]|nr:MAG: serine--tRNA ligase [Candidatus Cloacimonadota bacterium]
MLDIKFIRENPQLVAEAAANKNEKVDIEKILELDEKKRKLQFEYDNLRARQNSFSKQIPLLKKEKKDVSDLLAQMQEVSKKVKNLSAELTKINSILHDNLLKVPNIPHSDVPVGKDESANRFVREWGKKRDFGFVPKDHLKLAEINSLLDFNRSGKISGSGFAVYTGKGAMLERALINFMLDYHIKNHGYKEIIAPYLVNRKTITGTGQLPKLESDMYRIEEDDLFLIPTAEVSVTNYFADEIIPGKILPQKFVSFSACFRREAGSYGKDTKGLQRLHQFNKVEMVRFVHPQTSYKVLEEMVSDAEEILQQLELPYRIISLATGDLSFASAKTYDLEVWAPGTKKYLEVSSVSNFEDFQARRASIRFRDSDGTVKFVHTLNGSGLATPRTVIAILENYQNEDGSVSVPRVLQSYLFGLEIL